jgi:hypothetical protein
VGLNSRETRCGHRVPGKRGPRERALGDRNDSDCAMLPGPIFG